jgi:hypothetical protein
LTYPIAEVRDPQAALPIARRAVELSARRDPEILRALSLAHFETGDVDGAVATHREALGLCDESHVQLRAALEAELERFAAKR